jgi:hypothetical protein
MIVLLAASAVFLTASQGVINGPREAFRTCLRSATNKASNDKVTADGFEAYVRTNCGPQLGAFKGAVIKFDMGNKMSKRASDDDADSMIADFMGSAVDNYKYRTGGNSAPTQEASAPRAPSATLQPPQPTPASQPQPPK